MSDVSRCCVCGDRVLGRRRYCSDRCKWKARPRVPCSSCGGATGWSKGNPRAGANPRCRSCMRAPCGTPAAYGRGCRCDDCRAAKAAELRAYAAKVKARDGVSLRSKYRRKKNMTCAWCGAPVRSRAGRARDGLILCTRHRKEKRDAEAERDWISRRDRLAIYERDNWTCQLCGEPVDRQAHYLDDWAPTLDHIVPRSAALVPDHSPRNLRTAHRWCNSVRGDGTRYEEGVLRVA